MESTQPQPISTSECAPVNGKSATPFSQQIVVLTKQAYIRLTWEANYWRAQHACLVQREAALKAQVEMREAQVRDLNQRLYETKSEQSAGSEAAGQSTPASPRNRGQQPGMHSNSNFGSQDVSSWGSRLGVSLESSLVSSFSPLIMKSIK